MRPGDRGSAFDEFDASDVTQKNFYGVEATRNVIRSGGEPSALLMATSLLISRSTLQIHRKQHEDPTDEGSLPLRGDWFCDILMATPAKLVTRA